MSSSQKSKTVTVIGLFTILTGAAVLLGWVLNLQGLKSVLPGYESMKFNAALCFIFVGIVLLISQFQLKKNNAAVFVALSFLILLIGALSLSEYLFHFNIGIDQFFITDNVAIANKHPNPGLMAATTAMCFVFFSLAFLGFTFQSRFIHVLSQYLLHLVTAISVVALIGYLHGASVFYTLTYSSSIALHTALLFFLLSTAATLLHPSLGITGLFTGNLLGNKMAGRLFVLIVITLIIFDTLRVQAQRFKLFPPEINGSIFIVCILSVSLLLIWYTASWLNQSDIKRSEADDEVKTMNEEIKAMNEEVIAINEELEERVAERTTELYNLLEKYRESESKFRTAFEYSALGIALVSLKGIWLKVNNSLCEMFGYSEQELTSMSFMEITHPDDISSNFDIIESILTDEHGVRRMEKRYICKDGSVIWALVDIAIIRDDKGKPLYFVTQVANITERKIMEEKLKKSEEKYRSLIEQASDAIYMVDFKGNFTEVNESMCKMTGYSKAELLQLNVEEIIDPEQLKTDPVVPGYYDPDRSFIRERRILRKDGKIFDVEINVKLLGEDQVLVIARDITDRKLMEAELRAAEIKFRTLAEKSLVGIYIVQNGKFVYVNPRFAEIFGYEPKELINTIPVETIIHESYRLIALEHVKRRIAGDTESVHYDAMGKKKDGTTNWVEFYGSRAIIEGEPTIIGTMTDISERRRAEELTLREKTFSDTIINSLPGIFYLRNESGEYLRWNKNFETVTGYTSEEMKRINARDMIAKEDQEMIKKTVEKVFSDGYATAEAKVITKNGIKIPFLVSAASILYEDQKSLLGTGFDISSRIKAEEELTKLSFIAKHTINAVFIINLEGKIEWINDAFTDITGYRSNDVIGKTEEELFYHKDSIPSKLKYIKDKMSKGKPYKFEILKHSKTGNPFWVSVQGLPMLDAEGNFNRYFVLETEITKTKNAYEKLLFAERRIRNFAKQLNNALEEDRSHIAREIHDEFGQQLSGLKMSLSSLKKINGVPEEIINTLIADVNVSITTLRKIANELRPVLIDRLGLFAAIEWLVSEFENKTGIKCHMHVSPDQPPIDKIVAINIFRICQEAMTNIIKHAEATQVNIRIEQYDKQLFIKIMDNGKGFKSSVLQNPLSMGLLNMQERANMIGAELTINSSAQTGTIIELIVNNK